MSSSVRRGQYILVGGVAQKSSVHLHSRKHERAQRKMLSRFDPLRPRLHRCLCCIPIEHGQRVQHYHRGRKPKFKPETEDNRKRMTGRRRQNQHAWWRRCTCQSTGHPCEAPVTRRQRMHVSNLQLFVFSYVVAVFPPNRVEVLFKHWHGTPHHKDIRRVVSGNLAALQL